MYTLTIKNKEDIRTTKEELSKIQVAKIKKGIKAKKYIKFYYTTLAKMKYNNGGFDIIAIA